MFLKTIQAPLENYSVSHIPKKYYSKFCHLLWLKVQEIMLEGDRCAFDYQVICSFSFKEGQRLDAKMRKEDGWSQCSI